MRKVPVETKSTILWAVLLTCLLLVILYRSTTMTDFGLPVDVSDEPNLPSSPKSQSGRHEDCILDYVDKDTWTKYDRNKYAQARSHIGRSRQIISRRKTNMTVSVNETDLADSLDATNTTDTIESSATYYNSEQKSTKIKPTGGFNPVQCLPTHINSSPLTSNPEGKLQCPLKNLWQKRPLNSELSKLIKARQTSNCKEKRSHNVRNLGMGASLHIWSQMLCYAITRNISLVASGFWIWNDQILCDKIKGTFNCYFGNQDACPNDHAEFRRSAMELLFSNISEVLLNLTKTSAYSIFGEPCLPKDMISVHIRWGDKRREMTIQPVDEYVKAIELLITENKIQNPAIFLTTEDADAYSQFVVTARSNHPDWKASLVSLLIALEARYFVLTTASNWSRLINELRQSVTDVRCNNCTKMIDLQYGEW